MKDKTKNFKISDTWKTKLTITINLISSKNAHKEREMHLKSDNIEVMIYDKEATQGIIKSLLSRCQTSLERFMKRSDFVFNCVNLLSYKCHNIYLKRGGLYIDSRD